MSLHLHRLLGVLVAGLTLTGPARAELRPAGAGDNPAQPAAADATQVYIVQLRQPPAPRPAARGTVRAAAATTGEDLVRHHDQLLASVGAAGSKVYSFRYTLNGFAARLDAAQAAKLRASRDVAGVWPDRLRHLDTSDSPAYLGLQDASTGLRSARHLQGDGVVIGIIDSGVYPSHPSFDDTAEKPKPRLCRSAWADNSLLGKWLCARFRKPRRQVVYSPPAGWQGACEAGPRFPATSCNNKLVGARFYADGFQAQWTLDPGEPLSPLDVDGHGTHIASIAAGNAVTASIGGTSLAGISGMAPRAQVAVYKACWLQPGQTHGSCAMSDLAQAIEAAVADGVDVINYSVGTADGSATDPDALALLAANEAGVVTVVSAGNGGPGIGTVESPAAAPWTIAVGAATRTGTRYDTALSVTAPATVASSYATKEAGFTPTLRSTGAIARQLVLADDGFVAITGTAIGTTWDACEPLVNGAALAGNIALVNRGLCNFELKIANAEAAGAIAVVVYDTSDDLTLMSGTRGSVDIPAVMIGRTTGESLLARLQAGDTVTLTLDASLVLRVAETGGVLAKQSARGPGAELPEVLKPDVVAPGVHILGAQTPVVANGLQGESYQYLTGTSMAAPHVAGIAALLRQAHPSWSPAAIRSALVTTARQDVLLEDGASLAGTFDMGAGYMVPNRAVAPGLVYDAGADDYESFLCVAAPAVMLPDRCAALAGLGGPVTAADLNLPSIGLASLVATTTVHRRVTNVGAPGTWTAAVEAPDGVAVTVTPRTVSLRTGESADVALRLDNLGTHTEEWSFGALDWTGGPQLVRSPLAVHTTALVAPAEVSGAGADGSAEIPVQFGYTGAYVATPAGLLAADPAGTAQPLFVANDPAHAYTPGLDATSLPPSVARFAFTVPAGTLLLRVALYDDATDPNADLDLYLYCPGGQCTARNAILAAASEGSNETIDIRYPDPGDYQIDVHGFRTDGDGAHFRLYAWAVGPGAPATLQVAAPASVTTASADTLTATWQALAPGTRYLGTVSHSDGSRDLGFTIVSVKTN